MSVRGQQPEHAVKAMAMWVVILAVSGFMACNLMVFSHWQHRSAEYLGARATGRAQSLAEAFSGFLAVPIGRCSDRFGRAMVICMLGMGLMAAFIVMGFPPDSMQGPVSLVVGLALMKLFRLSEEISRAAIADACVAMGIPTSLWMSRLVAGAGSGLFIGPQLGTLIHSLGGWRLQNLAAAVLACCATSLIFMHAKSIDAVTTEKEEVAKRTMFSWGKFLQLIKTHRQLQQLLLVRFLMSAQFYVFISMLGTYFRSGLGLGPSELAFSASYVGALFAGMSAVIVPKVVRRVQLDRGLVGAILLVSSGRFAVFFWGRTYMSYLMIITFGIAGQATYLTYMATAVQAAAPEHLRATVGGAAQFCETGASVILPMLAGSMVERFGPFSHFLLSGCLALLAVLPASFVHKPAKHD